MDYALFALGLIMLAWSLWQFKFGRRAEGFNVEEIKLLRDELVKAKEDVDALLNELTSVSEQVVNDISEKIRAVEEVKPVATAAMPDVQPAGIDPVAIETAERIAKTVAKSQLKKEPKVIDINIHKQTMEAAGSKSVGSRFETVYTLAELGYSISEIAKQLKTGKGEVELILSLRHKEEITSG